MIVTADQRARAQALLAATPSQDINEADENDVDVPIATFRGLTRANHLEVNEWGGVLEATLRANNPKSRFALWIRGERIGAKTNAPIDTLAAAIVGNLDALRKGYTPIPPQIAIVFDTAISNSVTTLAAK